MSIQCKCREEDKHGTTTIACCNHCGLPTEKFWDNQSLPTITGAQEVIEELWNENKVTYHHANDSAYIMSFEGFSKAMKDFASINQEGGEGDALSIDALLSEFKRQGIDTTNWDGDEGAEKAIVDGVKNILASSTVQGEEDTIISINDTGDRWRFFAPGGIEIFPDDKGNLVVPSTPPTSGNKMEEALREMAGMAWKSCANSYRIYPDNKHTFVDYWSTIGKRQSTELLSSLPCI